MVNPASSGTLCPRHVLVLLAEGAQVVLELIPNKGAAGHIDGGLGWLVLGGKSLEKVVAFVALAEGLAGVAGQLRVSLLTKGEKRV